MENMTLFQTNCLNILLGCLVILGIVATIFMLTALVGAIISYIKEKF